MDRNLQIATVVLLVILIIMLAWVALQIRPIADLANSRVAHIIGGIGA